MLHLLHHGELLKSELVAIKHFVDLWHVLLVLGQELEYAVDATEMLSLSICDENLVDLNLGTVQKFLECLDEA